jgi:hypothetical protein
MTPMQKTQKRRVPVCASHPDAEGPGRSNRHPPSLAQKQSQDLLACLDGLNIAGETIDISLLPELAVSPAKNGSPYRHLSGAMRGD